MIFSGVEAKSMSADQYKPVRVTVDAGAWLGELAHNWNYIGYDECNTTYTPEGQELLDKFMQMALGTTALGTTALSTTALGALRTQTSPYYVRAHHLLCTGNCHGFYKWGSTNV